MDKYKREEMKKKFPGDYILIPKMKKKKSIKL